jgi:hypothetical protein
MGVSMLRVLLAALLLAMLASSVSAEPPRTGASELQGQPQQAIVTLKDGTKIIFLKGFTVDAQGAPGSKALFGAFQLQDEALLSNHARLIEIADLLFGGIVIVGAEQQGYKHAALGFLRSQSAAAGATVELYEDFHYKRGDNAVWLRQAGSEPWKVAQDPNEWKAPTPEIVDLGEYGKAEQVFFGEIMGPPGRKKALGVELYTPTPARTGRKIEELRAYWNSLDHDKLKADGFDTVMIQNYEERGRGKFHLRQMAFLVMAMFPNGEWPKLPDGPLTPEGTPVITAEASKSTFEIIAAKLGTSAPATLAAPSPKPAAHHGAGLATQALGPALPSARYKRR